MSTARERTGGRGRRGAVARWALLALAAGALLATACADDSPPNEWPPTPTAGPSAPPSGTLTPVASPDELPGQVKVSFINLLSPLSLDANNPVAAETFDQRLETLAEELRAFNPDIAGFNEASWTKGTGSAAEKLAKALKMELQYARANPWFPGQTKEQSDETVKLTGFEEGELILSRYPILRYERRALNPRTSETGEGRAALHVVLRGPGTLGEIDVYITHITGGDEKVRSAQAADFITFISATRGKGPLLVMGDLGEGPEGPVAKALAAAGLADVVAAAARPGEAPIATCCREAILGEQLPLVGRTDYIFVAGLAIGPVEPFGLLPRKRADGTLVYASDHNGIEVTFAIPDPPP